MKTACLILVTALAAAAMGNSKEPPNYAAACSTPLKDWGTEKDGIRHLLVPLPVYVRSDGSVLWNKVAISDAQLRQYMDEVSGMNPVPQIILEFSPSVPCRRVAAIRAIMDAAPACKERYCSEGRNWKRWPITGGP